MKNKDVALKVLNELLDELQLELKEIDENLDLHKNLLREDKEYLDYLMNQESEDHMVFSPRNIADIHRDEIKEISLRREKMTAENSVLIERRTVLHRYIEKIEIAVKNIV